MPEAISVPRMETSATPRPRRLPLVALSLVLGILWFVCCRHLSNEWRFNEQYSYGWFVPFFAAYLFWLRWEDRPKRFQISDFRFQIAALFIIAVAALILLPLRVFEIANPDWRPLGWIHGIATIAITLSIVYLIGGASWVRHFSFPIFFLLTAVPWPSLVEEPIVQGLMRDVASAAAETMSLFGVPAQVDGNLIRLANGVVGVNEACSGVRSLQTSLMIGLLFGELKRLTVGRRIVLVLAALGIALAANFGRSLFLVAIAARENIAAVGKWHDLAGYTIVALVFFGTMWTARKLESTRAKVGKEPPVSPYLPFRISQYLPFTFSSVLLTWLVVVEVSAEMWYRTHERGSIAQPAWTVRWPESIPGFRQININNDIRATLRYDSGREASCKVALPDASDAHTFIYFFRWNAGTSSTVLRARSHRPDICLPAAGWNQIEDSGYHDVVVDSSLTLPVRRVTFEQPRDHVVAHTYFCLQEDVTNPRDTRPDLGTRNGVQPDWAYEGRWRIVRDGIRNRGQQVLEVIMVTPAQVADAVVDEKFRELLKQLVQPKISTSDV